MGIFSFLRSPDINKSIADFNSSEGTVLLDVRGEDEYNEGHIEKSVNLPLDKIALITDTVKDKNTPLYVYCYSGGRSERAVTCLKKMGYTNVINIGGICSYRGKVVK